MVAVNPLFFCYGSVVNVEAYAGPSAVFVTGEGNRHNPAFKAARARGAEVLTYLDLTARPIATTNPIWLGIYMNDLAKVPLWGRDENGEWRTNWPGKYLIDTRVGSAWTDYAVDYVANLMHSGEFSGVFLDVVGCRNWGKVSKWDSWPQAEREEWTAGNVDLVRRLHLKRMEINPDFLLINNNIWIYPEQKIDASVAEQYVDGICLEGHKATVLKNGQTIQSWHWNHAKRTFGNLGQRRMLIISNSTADAEVWATHPDVTHVTSVNTALGQSYKAATPPVVKPTDIRLEELRGKVLLLRQQLAAPSDGAVRIAELTQQLAATRAELAATYDQLTGAVSASKVLSGRIDVLTTKLSTLSEQLTALAEVARE